MIRENAHIPYPVAKNSNVPLTLEKIILAALRLAAAEMRKDLMEPGDN